MGQAPSPLVLTITVLPNATTVCRWLTSNQLADLKSGAFAGLGSLQELYVYPAVHARSKFRQHVQALAVILGIVFLNMSERDCSAHSRVHVQSANSGGHGTHTPVRGIYIESKGEATKTALCVDRHVSFRVL